MVAVLCGVFTGLLVNRALADPPGPGYSLTWSDEFNGSSLDLSKWNYRQLGTRHDAVNVKDAVTVGGGDLTIETYSVSSGTSLVNHTGMIGTQNLFQQRYGYFEARIAFDNAPGEWSAFWIQSPTIGNPIGNAAVAGTEMDVVEHRQVDSGNNDVSNKIDHALHWDGYSSSEQSLVFYTSNLGLASGFHLYGMAWDPSGYRFYVDNNLTWTVTQSNSISQRDEYLILSSEVQNNSWAGSIPTGGYGDAASSPVRMTVDYVRVYSLPEPASLTLLVIGVLGALCYAWRRRQRGL